MGDNTAAAKRAAETSGDLKTQAKVKYFGYQITARHSGIVLDAAANIQDMRCYLPISERNLGHVFDNSSGIKSGV